MPPADALAGIPTVSQGSLPLPGPLPTSQAEGLASSGLNTCTAAAALCNLLPVTGLWHTSATDTGIYIGEGLPPVPTKLAEKIRKWEFVDMAELLPEFWGSPSGARLEATGQPGGTATLAPQRRRRKVTDIVSWIQCYATYVGVLAGGNPEAVPELMAYLINIMRVSQDFGGMAWVNYDLAFRRQAASTGNRQWSRVNLSLYSICFAGAARASKRCDLCLSLTHEAKDCALSGDADPDVGQRLKSIESAVLALTSTRPAGSGPTQSRQPGKEICRNWNANRCSFPRCRFRHVCRVCEGPRPATECCERALGLPGQPPSRTQTGKGREPSRPY